MCTVTWLHQPNGYQLFFNRDEKKARAAAAPPSVHEREGMHVIYPVDRQEGGTWLGVNERGVVVGVLNHHPPGWEDDGRKRTSRGHLVAALLGSPRAETALDTARAADLSAYRPFILFGLEPGGAFLTFSWSGTEAELRTPDAPCVTTSSFDAGDVVTARLAFFRDVCAQTGGPDEGALFAFHQSAQPRGGAYGVCMERDDAQTVSFSHIRVTDDLVRFTYTDGPPCRAYPLPPVELQRS